MTRFALRRDTAANWTSVNPVLAAGEEGYETDTRRRKVGDGTTAWTGLPYTTGLTIQDENVQVGTGVSQLDFQGAGVTAAAGSGGEVVITIPGGGGGGTATMSYPYNPADFGLLGWSGAPHVGSDAVNVGGSGRSLFVRTHVVSAGTIGNINIGIRTAGATLTTGNYFALYALNADGTTMDRVAITADLTTELTTTGFKTIPFTTTYAATAGQALYVGIVNNATTLPSYAKLPSDTLGGIQTSLGDASNRMAYANTVSSTTLPTSVNRSGSTPSIALVWIGLRA